MRLKGGSGSNPRLGGCGYMVINNPSLEDQSIACIRLFFSVVWKTPDERDKCAERRDSNKIPAQAS